MKKIVLMLLISFAENVLFSANVNSKVAEGITPKKTLKEIIYQKTGGTLRRNATGLGRFLFINCQTAVPNSELNAPIMTLTRILRSTFDLEEGVAPKVSDVPATMARYNAQGVIFIVDDPSLPISLVAPESMWGIVNVSPLKIDGDIPIQLAERVRKEMWRTFALVNGAGNSSFPGCVLKDAFSAKDIDALEGKSFCPEPMPKISAHLVAAGIKPFSICSYRQACVEGWAPAPTNDIQKAIWDKVHAIPDKPMKIKFDPAAQKGKVTK